MSSGRVTRRAGVIGWPIAHSRSPLIHNYWLKRYGIDGSYERIPVAPETLPEFLAGFEASGLAGCNVTVPHKEQVARRVTINDDETRRLGSVNTLWLDNGTLHGTSTDGYGFLQNLLQQAPQLGPLSGHRILILGAGGAARPVIAALQSAGATDITVVNRTISRAEELANALGPGIIVKAWSDMARCLRNTTLLVNTTSLGMNGAEPLRIDLTPLPAEATVADIVYVPVETDLLKQARQRGLHCVGGLGMLLHQAGPGFARWFGREPEVTDELRMLVARDIEGT